MDPNEDPNDPNHGKKKKLNEDFVTFMKKRSEHDAPQYTSRLRNYVTLQEKRSRANHARMHYEQRKAEQNSTSAERRERRERKERREQREAEAREREREGNSANPDENIVRARRSHQCCGIGREQPGNHDSRVTRRRSRGRSMSISGSDGEPSDRCGRRRRRRRKKRCRCGGRRRRRRRRRSRRRRRRRRGSCCCKKRRRRRRRSCSRRRRRRSCRRRRRRRRRRRC